ncbi:MAG: G8 domain-containing protein, partial [Acidobacteriota bacterium]|nr:G8 domain-containing protein [Acidobacteriota bacterium]
MKKLSRKFSRKYVVLTLFLFGVSLSAIFLFFVDNKSEAQIRKEISRNQDRNVIVPRGEAPVLVASTVINFAEIAAHEEKFGVKPDKTRIPPFMPDPDMPDPNDYLGQNLEKFDFEDDSKSFENLAPAIASPTPNANFQGLNDNDTSIPPDTHGAAGPNHLMVTLNTQVRIQNKTGGTTSTVSLNAFWTSVNGGSGAFDPKVLYDPFAGRWMITTCDDAVSANSGLMIGVSQTNDPTGMWNLYKYDYDAANIEWADYPSIGFNKNWIVVSMNDFTIAGNAFNGAQSYIFDKSTLYAGAVSPTLTVFDYGTTLGATHVPALTYDNTLNTLHLVTRWNSGSGSLRLFTITGTAAVPVVTATSFFPSTTAWTSAAPNDFAPQSGTATGIMNNDSRMQNAVYRDGKLWATQTIFLPAGGSPTRSAVQWWEINPVTGAVNQVGRIDDATATNFYSFPTIAVNAANQALIGYSAFSASTFASAAYSYRGVTDAVNTLRDPLTYKAGLDCYRKTFSGSTNRWGDYSNTVVDPVDDTTFWTLQEYADTAVVPCTANNNGRWGVWWAKLIPPCTSQVTSGNWSTTGTWGCGNVPAASDDAVVITGQTVTLDVDPVAASVTVNSGGTLATSGTRAASSDIDLNGTLDLTNGILNMGTNTLKIGCGGAVTGASATGYVIGKVEKEFCATGSFSYPVGENGYSPMTANVTALSTNPTTLTVDVIDAILPDIAPANSATRHWDLTGSGMTADLSFTYL